MTDEQESRVMDELARMREAMEELRDVMKARRKPKKAANPTLEDVQKYAESRGRGDMAKRFFEHYTVDDTKKWTDRGGNPIYNWKSTFVQWERRDPAKKDTRSIWE